MLATIALATAVLGGHTQPSGMFMFAAVFPAEARLLGNEFRMIAQGLGEEPETEQAAPVMILLACLGLASL